jgi:hypothetical protein
MTTDMAKGSEHTPIACKGDMIHKQQFPDAHLLQHEDTSRSKQRGICRAVQKEDLGAKHNSKQGKNQA